jgi:AraC-like DNA-binding protein
MVPTTYSIQERSFSVDDFSDFGHRHGIDYRFPTLSCQEGYPAADQVVQGKIEEMYLSSGIFLSNSDIDVLQPYESESLGLTPLFVLVVLEGSVSIWTEGREHVVRAGMALRTSLNRRLAMGATHAANQHLRTLTLAINLNRLQTNPALVALMQTWMMQPEETTDIWHIPNHLQVGLQQGLEQKWTGLQRQLVLEGLALQLLAHSLSPVETVRHKDAVLAPSERMRLEAVREALQQRPAEEHTLQVLAELAAMSPSSLRAKFRQAYGQSVFDYLRDCRLHQAWQYLEQGYSVQQAAHLCGYHHATNFATAFRRRYGISPSALV